jgi:hypothetical protein
MFRKIADHNLHYALLGGVKELERKEIVPRDSLRTIRKLVQEMTSGRFGNSIDVRMQPSVDEGKVWAAVRNRCHWMAMTVSHKTRTRVLLKLFLLPLFFNHAHKSIHHEVEPGVLKRYRAWCDAPNGARGSPEDVYPVEEPRAGFLPAIRLRAPGGGGAAGGGRIDAKGDVRDTTREPVSVLPVYRMRAPPAPRDKGTFWPKDDEATMARRPPPPPGPSSSPPKRERVVPEGFTREWDLAQAGIEEVDPPESKEEVIRMAEQAKREVRELEEREAQAAADAEVQRRIRLNERDEYVPESSDDAAARERSTKERRERETKAIAAMKATATPVRTLPRNVPTTYQLNFVYLPEHPGDRPLHEHDVGRDLLSNVAEWAQLNQTVNTVVWFHPAWTLEKDVRASERWIKGRCLEENGWNLSTLLFEDMTVLLGGDFDRDRHRKTPVTHMGDVFEQNLSIPHSFREDVVRAWVSTFGGFSTPASDASTNTSVVLDMNIEPLEPRVLFDDVTCLSLHCYKLVPLRREFPSSRDMGLSLITNLSLKFLQDQCMHAFHSVVKDGSPRGQLAHAVLDAVADLEDRTFRSIVGFPEAERGEGIPFGELSETVEESMTVLQADGSLVPRLFSPKDVRTIRWMGVYDEATSGMLPRPLLAADSPIVFPWDAAFRRSGKRPALSSPIAADPFA